MSNNIAPFTIRVVALTFAIALTALILPGVGLEGGVLQLILLAFVLALLNMILRPILLFISIPLLVLTVGLFTVVINALLLSWAAELTDWLSIEGFGWALLGGLVVSIFSTAIQMFIGGRKDKGSVQTFRISE